MIAFSPQPAEEDVFLALRLSYVVALSCFRFCLSFVAWFLLLSPFLATMFFAGYFHVRFVLSAFFPIFCFDFFSSTVLVSGLFWCNSIYLVTTAGLVADP